jgi:zinc-dependent metalloproteinase lipoprotein
MNKIIFLFISVSLLLAGVPSYGQQLNKGGDIETKIVPCSSVEYEQYIRSASHKSSVEEFEGWMHTKIASAQQEGQRNIHQVVSLPVVVHVIYDGDEVGISENIEDTRIFSQIEVLNQDFRHIDGTPGSIEGSAGVDTEIQFCLAQQDPDGNPTTGIDRINLGRTSWNSMETVDESMKALTIWDPERYVNIWVCRFGGQLAQIGGYAYFPESSTLDGLEGAESNATNDGLVISFKAFGTSDIYPATNYFPGYDKGRSTTHEMGHFLGLRHIWGDASSCDATDYCDDTPAVSGVHSECIAVDSCPDSLGVDMIENHMDYTPDSCKGIYTSGQKLRMWTVLQNSPRRISLLTSNACSAPAMGLGNGNSLNTIKLYPNPVKDVLYINTGVNLLNTPYSIYNVLGEVVDKGTLSTNGEATISTGKLSIGVYSISIIHEAGTKTVRFIKN